MEALAASVVVQLALSTFTCYFFYFRMDSPTVILTVQHPKSRNTDVLLQSYLTSIQLFRSLLAGQLIMLIEI
jgi:hypothetical protein